MTQKYVKIFLWFSLLFFVSSPSFANTTLFEGKSDKARYIFELVKNGKEQFGRYYSANEGIDRFYILRKTKLFDCKNFDDDMKCNSEKSIGVFDEAKKFVSFNKDGEKFRIAVIGKYNLPITKLEQYISTNLNDDAYVSTKFQNFPTKVKSVNENVKISVDLRTNALIPVLKDKNFLKLNQLFHKYAMKDSVDALNCASSLSVRHPETKGSDILIDNKVDVDILDADHVSYYKNTTMLCSDSHGAYREASAHIFDNKGIKVALDAALLAKIVDCSNNVCKINYQNMTDVQYYDDEENLSTVKNTKDIDECLEISVNTVDQFTILPKSNNVYDLIITNADYAANTCNRKIIKFKLKR